LLNIQKTVDVFTHKEWLVIYAGAANPSEAAYSYTYNWLEFSLAETAGQHYLVMDVFPRVWVQQTVRFDADRTRLGASGESVRIEIACSGLHPEPAVKSTASSLSEISAAIPAKSSVDTLTLVSAIGPASAGKQGSAMSTNNAGFDRLRYLFWRYLDWRQRLQVLVQVDALPQTSDRPVPQTLERVALETAAKNPKKLYDLWEAVMQLVPEEKRSPNPFQSNG
jgi:hypothetical protein